MSATHLLSLPSVRCSRSLPGVGAGLVLLEACFHCRLGPKAPDSFHQSTRHRRPHEGDRQRQEEVRAIPRALVLSCYEAGRDGFWLHRFLTSKGVQNIVVDAASIEVNRRLRRAKSDNLDAAKLVGMLIRWHNGEKKLWAVIRVPTVEDEDRRQLHRELIELKTGRTEIVNRIKGLLAGLGLPITVDDVLPLRLAGLRQWDDTEVPPALHQRILREFERWQLIGRQIHDLETERTQPVRDRQTPRWSK